jgi:hypothetical protein
VLVELDDELLEDELDDVVVVVTVVLELDCELEELVVTVGAELIPNAEPRKACALDKVALTAKLSAGTESCSHSANTVGVFE